jgi:hypothetical protein
LPKLRVLTEGLVRTYKAFVSFSSGVGKNYKMVPWLVGADWPSRRNGLKSVLPFRGCWLLLASTIGSVLCIKCSITESLANREIVVVYDDVLIRCSVGYRSGRSDNNWLVKECDSGNNFLDTAKKAEIIQDDGLGNRVPELLSEPRPQ